MTQTRLLFLDDSNQRECPRDGMSELQAMGGISIAATEAKALNDQLDKLCDRYGFPKGEPFKWSPNKNQWFRQGLDRETKAEFFEEVFNLAKSHNAVAIAAMCDPKAQPVKGAIEPEIGPLLAALERFELTLAPKEFGVVIVDRPPGSKSDEEQYLLKLLELIDGGSVFARFDKLACPIVSMPLKLSRLLQTADLVVSITTAYFAGFKGAEAHFKAIKPLLRSEKNRIGGVSIKAHPDFRFANLYHWLLGDSHFVRGSTGVPMPLANRPYREGPDKK